MGPRWRAIDTVDISDTSRQGAEHVLRVGESRQQNRLFFNMTSFEISAMSVVQMAVACEDPKCLVLQYRSVGQEWATAMNDIM